ncbi:MAG: hypothetical protein F6K36_22410 [Symploca sp. SIO3C6]|uniref:Uncharacterized protein n=1 Tax=Symploca sp. SIO1C4 TaxID=2607765 RepID=A0A6B3MYB4_9CYAN|nr:hypothetical protein [Symploca sp. SIO3C6]NER26406.1 hypothetical protein [Symploca sp. SIO1C4]NET04404.1 hypothetical protein [Symploca sp. SIO2B6]
MKYPVAALTVLLTLCLGVPVAAQSRNSSQDFFEQGWDELEREVRILQTEESDPAKLLSDPEELLQQSPSESTLEVCPDPDSELNQQFNEEEIPCRTLEIEERSNNN